MAIVTGFDPNNASDNILALYRAIRKISSGSSLPSQTGNNGKFLSTNGVDASWITLTGGGNMSTSTYDPTGVSGDAFDYNNFFNTPTIPTTPTLADVLDLGNTSGPNDIVFDATYGLEFDNSSRLREGTIDAGLGGNNDIAQICGAGYELKWEGGRQYVMGSSGNTIRQSLYNFSTTPTVNDDTTKGYAVGSLWTLDNGVTYRCSDASTGSAVWSISSSGDFITLTKADWQTLITNNLVIPNQQYYVTDAIDGGGLWTTDIGAKFTAGDKYGSILGSVYFVEIQSWGDGNSILSDFSTNDMFIYEFNSTLTDVQVSWIVANELPSNYFFPYTKVKLGCQLVIPSGIGYGFVVETNVWDDAIGISLNACRTISISNPSVPCIYDEPTGNAYITLVDAKVSLNAVTLLAGGLVDVVEFPAVPNYFWDITDAIENYSYGTVDYDNLTIDVITKDNGAQWNDNSQCTGSIINIFSSMKETSNTAAREFAANKKIQLDITASTQGDGTMIVYLTGKLRAI